MRLALYSRVSEGDVPNLIALQDEALFALPTVLVCPLRTEMKMTLLRVKVPFSDRVLIACLELARPIRRTVLRPLGWLEPDLSRELMQRFLLLLAR